MLVRGYYRWRWLNCISVPVVSNVRRLSGRALGRAAQAQFLPPLVCRSGRAIVCITMLRSTEVELALDWDRKATG